MQIHFWTKDINRAIQFYTSTLGFTLTYSQPKEEPLDFCIMHLEDQQVMFGIPPHALVALERNDKPLMEAILTRIEQNGPLSIYLSVTGIEAHFAHSKSQGANILEPLWQTPWGLSQYSLEDMDGQFLTFYSDK